ncbi:MAG: class I SAM-dependent methyltransferase [Micrococcales bacterium]|nr:class I SAM-dependent methyltransferase [Micrococcales bacterium]MCL2666275.1 class I SAM-dependent methyltransferase [Micrococcales bacterium]
MVQNIYDDQEFYDGYQRVRDNADSANNVEERPAIVSLLPDLRGKRVLDLGCGQGHGCRLYSDLGAGSVLGIDISEKMLAVARELNSASNISYRRLSMEEVGGLPPSFDVVVSSLAVHYVEDFVSLARDVFLLLSDGGHFVFSQEHPLTTAPKAGIHWAYDTDGSPAYYQLSDYSVSSQRTIFWIVDGVVKHHRTFSDIINSLVSVGFAIDRVLEPVVPEEVVQRIPNYQKNRHVPNFLLVDARKPSPAAR